MTDPHDAPRLRFREARAEDQPQIARMTQDIWGGDDYLAKVWHEWVQAPHSVMCVGLLGDEIVATGRVIELTPGGWWLEGLRVHPAYQGQGLATQLHDYLVAAALRQPGIRSLGLATYAGNEKVAHLATRSGMQRHATYRFLKAGALPEPVPDVRPAADLDAAALMARLRTSRWLRASGGYVMRGWVAHPVTEAWLEEVIGSGGAWRCGDALALTSPADTADRAWLYLVAGGDETAQEALAHHARHLAHRVAPDAYLRGFAPLDDALQRPLLAADLHDPYEDGPFHIAHFLKHVSGDASP